MDSHSWFLTLSFVLFIVGIWLIVTVLLSYLSGWAFLAKYNRAAQLFTGRYECVSISQMGPLGPLGGMRSALYVGVDALGLHLRIFILFRLNCRDLFLPWSEIAVMTGRSFFTEYVEFHFRQTPRISLRIYGKAGQVIRERAGPAWPVEATRDFVQR